MNTVRHTVCPAGTPIGTPAVRHAGACWVQNQNQNQNSLTAVCGVCGYDSIHRYCRNAAGARGEWMDK